MLVVLPSMLFNLLRKYESSRVLYALAIAVRALFGVALLMVAPASQFPFALTAIGWVAIGAAAFIGVIGPSRFSKLMSGVLGIPNTWGRVAGAFTVLFGGFLVYAVQ